jgi:hypothetical protein
VTIRCPQCHKPLNSKVILSLYGKLMSSRRKVFKAGPGRGHKKGLVKSNAC